MSRSKVVVATDWAVVGSGIATFTVEKEGDGALFVNDVADDETADGSLTRKGLQFMQNETRDTFARADGDGWVLFVDTAGV